MIYDAYEVVIVPFPFTDRGTSKRRPALVVSDGPVFNNPVSQSVLAMITSRGHEPWPLDVPIRDLQPTGLRSPSVVRMKLFTLDHELILRKSGRLGPDDERKVRESLARLLRFASEA